MEPSAGERAPGTGALPGFPAHGWGGEEDQAISDILTAHGFWRIDRILDRRFAGSALPDDHRDDVRAEILLRLVVRLRRLLREPGEEVRDLPSYISVVAFNTFDDFLRRKYPLRTKLRNRVRYALGHTPRLALWEDRSETLCGLREWIGQRPVTGVLRPRLTETSDLRAALDELFRVSRGPLKLDAAVSLIAAAFLPPEDDAPLSDTTAGSPVEQPGEQMESRQYLGVVWSEMRTLPLRQRVALILSARDASGESITRLLPVTRIATVREIAASVGLAAEEFAALWDDLPLDDMRIAAMLHSSRQQVINLRRSARDRLTRRLRQTAVSTGGSR